MYNIERSKLHCKRLNTEASISWPEYKVYGELYKYKRVKFVIQSFSIKELSQAKNNLKHMSKILL